MQSKVSWGILATGAIARAFARGVAASETGTLLAVGSRTAEKAEAFGAEFSVPRRYGSYEALLADRDVQAVYVSTPHPFHAEWAIKAAEAGKHVLVEKPMGVHQYEAQAMVEAAIEHGTFLMEAFMYRCHPQTARLLELLREKAVGDVRVIQATFSFHAAFRAESRLWSNAMAGGGILDVGGYTTSMARLAAGAALGRPFADPLSVSGAGHLDTRTGVDAWAAATLRFPSDIVAQVSTGVGVNQENVVRIYGSEGRIVLPDPWVMKREGAQPGRIQVQNNGEKEPREIVLDSPVTSYAHEADAVGRALAAGLRQAPQMPWDDSLGNARTQDAWRAAIGLVYEAERPENAVHTVSRRPLAAGPRRRMETGTIPGVDGPVSRLVMGVDNQNTMPHAAAVFDEYFLRGGNAFDTAWVYGAARSQLLGRWIRNRDVRRQVVLIAKGAHTPLCNPRALESQLAEQLEWLQTDRADIYMMHRDNPEVPVGEFVDALNKLAGAGRIGAFGGSNWTRERVEAANAYARDRGLRGFTVLSNNLSLARMVDPVWAGCLHVHDAASRAWIRASGLVLLPWSSQARGFFLPGRAHPDRRDDAELSRCWYSEANFRRLERAGELAAARGVEPVNVALAWVLRQPFPCFPLIGPRTLAEVRSTCRALEVELDEREMRYLDLEP